MPSPCFTWCAEWLVFLFSAGAGVQSWVLTLQCLHWPGLLLIHFYVCTWLLLLLLILYTLTLILCILQIKKHLNFLSIGCCNNETAVAGVCSMHAYIYIYLVFNVITAGHTHTMHRYFKPLSMGFLIPLIKCPIAYFSFRLCREKLFSSYHIGLHFYKILCCTTGTPVFFGLI